MFNMILELHSYAMRQEKGGKCINRKNKKPIICEEERMAIVSSIRYVDEVVRQEDMNKIEPVKKLKVDVVFVGSDWKGTKEWDGYEKEFATVGYSVEYLDHTDGISSSILRERLNEK